MTNEEREEKIRVIIATQLSPRDGSVKSNIQIYNGGVTLQIVLGDEYGEKEYKDFRISVVNFFFNTLKVNNLKITGSFAQKYLNVFYKQDEN